MSTCESKIRQRNSRACDQCRKLRIRCNRTVASEPCGNCLRRKFDCTAEGIDHKRGPPKGYLHTLEDRLQDAEAIIGVLLALPDPHVQHLLQTLSQDPQAREVFNRVEYSAFGPSGRKLRSWLVEAVNNSDTAELRQHTRLGLANDTASPLSTKNVNTWQDSLIQIFTNASKNVASPVEDFSLLFSPHLSSQPIWSNYERPQSAATVGEPPRSSSANYLSPSEDYQFSAFSPRSY